MDNNIYVIDKMFSRSFELPADGRIDPWTHEKVVRVDRFAIEAKSQDGDFRLLIFEMGANHLVYGRCAWNDAVGMPLWVFRGRATARAGMRRLQQMLENKDCERWDVAALEGLSAYRLVELKTIIHSEPVVD